MTNQNLTLTANALLACEAFFGNHSFSLFQKGDDYYERSCSWEGFRRHAASHPMCFPRESPPPPQPHPLRFSCVTLAALPHPHAPSPAAPPSSRTASGGGGGTSPPARACSARRASTASHLTSQPLARSRRCATRPSCDVTWIGRAPTHRLLRSFVRLLRRPPPACPPPCRQPFHARVSRLLLRLHLRQFLLDLILSYLF